MADASQAPHPMVNISNVADVRFPPFPAVPPGVTIVPFKEFKEHGIQMFSGDDDIEVDGLGIPTIQLRVKHDTDVSKTDPKKAKKKKAAASGPRTSASGITIRKEWWDHWEEGEDLRSTSANDPNLPRVDRIHLAAGDFVRGRTWPPGPTGVRNLWDQFRLFAGLLSNTPIWRRTDQDDEGEEIDSDDEDDLDSVNMASANAFKTNPGEGPVHKRFARPRPRPPYANYGTEPTEVDSDAGVRKLLDEESERKEERLLSFLNDPEGVMKVFLSSYMLQEGLVWSDRNLLNMPILMSFFISFLLRSRVLPDTTSERSLRRTLEVIVQAQNDLPLTSKIAKLVPDEFSQASRECWGAKADGFRKLYELPTEDESKESAADGGISESVPKKAKFDEPATWGADDEFIEELKADNVEVIEMKDDIDLEDAAKIIIDDNADDPDNGGWGSEAWGQSEAYDPSSFAATIDPTSNNWTVPEVIWEPPELDSLLTLLGPTALPLTHTTGVVEWSFRRIKSVTPPPAVIAKSPSAGDVEPDADAVELELERRFAKVVMEPWTDWYRDTDAERGEIARPRILVTSRGAVVDPSTSGENKKDIVVEEAGVTPAPGATSDALPPHDPLKDEITVLVLPSVAETLGTGLGLALCGTWVQIAREQDLGGDGPKKKKKKSKSKTKKVPLRYWYLDEVIMVLPSYYTV